MTEGRIESADRVRTYPRALTRLVDEVAAAANAWGPTKVILAHAARPETAQSMAGRVAEITGEPPRIVEIGGVLGCHAGPGGFGVGMHPASVLED